jgi:osmoprotectant transport system permease protein
MCRTAGQIIFLEKDANLTHVPELEQETKLSTVSFISNNLGVCAALTVEHLEIVGVSVVFAIFTGIPLGILSSTSETFAKCVLYVASIIMTIPSVALFGIMIPVLSLIGQGIGFLPAVAALSLYAQLPIIRNTYAAISNIDPALYEAANGMGMTTLQRLRKVEIPIALPIIMAGVRMAVVINIGIATISAYIGAGGLGKLISRGIAQTDIDQVVTGAILVSVLAIAADYGLGLLQRLLTPKGLRLPSRTTTVLSRLFKSAAFRNLRQHTQGQS